MFGKIRKAITANFNTKVLALVIALSIWFYASSQLTEKRVVSVQVELKPPTGYTMVYSSRREVDVTVSGPASALEALQRSARTPIMQHQLSEATVGAGEDPPRLETVTIRMEPEWIDWRIERWQSDRLRVQEIDPGTITIAAEPVIEEIIPVTVRTPLDMQDSLTWTPDQATVRGPAAVVREMGSIGLGENQTLFDVGRTAQSKSLQRRVRIPFEGEMLSVDIQVEPRRVDVMLDEDDPQSEAEATFTDVPVRLLVPMQFPYDARIAEEQPRTVTVHVRAMPDALNRLQRDLDEDRTALIAYVDLGNLPEEISPGQTYTEFVRVRLPNDVMAREVSVPDPENPNVNLELPILLEEKPPPTP
jgi:hypothetical protein